MPIRVTCLHCGKQFTAWDNLVGKTVKCPKCASLMTIPGLPAGPAQPARNSANATPGSSTRTSSPVAPSGDRTSQPSRTVKVTAHAKPAESRQAVLHPPQHPRPEMPAGTGTSTPQQTLEKVGVLPCPNCNSPMVPNDELCDACGYHLILRKVLDLRDIRQANDTTGFKRLVQNQLAEGVTVEDVMFWAQLLAGFCLVFFCLLCFGRWGLLLAVAGVLAFLVYRHAWPRGVRADSAANEGGLSRLLWSAVLFVERAAGWRLPEWPFPKARVFSLQDPTFTDDELGELDELEKFDVIDFQGTQITDAGVAHLEALKQLRFLVLRDTRVTPAGAAGLQRSLPRTWIWY